MGYGTYWEELNKERVESFLYNLAGYGERLRAYPRQGNAALLDKLGGLISEYLGCPRRQALRMQDGGESDGGT